MNSKVNAQIEFTINISLTEVEARALEAIVGYGYDPFEKVFYQHLGEHYLKPHAKGAKTLFEHVRQDLGQKLRNVDIAKKAINDLNVISA